MSPRRRGRGRHGGAIGTPTPTGVVSPNGPAPLDGEPVVDSGAGGSANGGSANGGSANGVHGDRVEQRPPMRSRGSGRPAGFTPRPVAAPAVAVPATAESAADHDVDAPDGIAAGVGEAQAPRIRRVSCTLAQMRRFIKSRPYVPVHELRRRFEIEGIEDEVSPVATGSGTIYVGLPPEQASFLGELVRAGDVGCEMLLDPDSPAVVGVFPMRPVARQ